MVGLTTVRCESKVSTLKGAKQLNSRGGMRTLAIDLLVRLLVRRCRVVATRGNVIATVFGGERDGGWRWVLCWLVPDRRQTSASVRA